MTMLRKGEEVTVHCQICASPINPTANYNGRVCGRECHEELEWRKVLSIHQGKIGKWGGFARYEPRSEVAE